MALIKRRLIAFKSQRNVFLGGTATFEVLTVLRTPEKPLPQKGSRLGGQVTGVIFKWPFLEVVPLTLVELRHHTYPK